MSYDDDENTPPRKPRVGGKLLFMFILGGIFLVMFFGTMQASLGGRVQEIPNWSTFRTMVDEGKIEHIDVHGRTVSGKLKNGSEFNRFTVTGPDFLSDIDKQWLYDAAKSKGFTVAFHEPSIWMAQIINILLWVGILVLLFWLLSRMAGGGAGGGGGIFNFGKSRATLVTKDKNRKTFEDVAGIDEAKEEVTEVVDFLKNPRKYQRLGGRIPRGILLVGLPGTGKTLLAKAIAGEANVPFYSISGSDFVEMFVGVGASRVRNMFTEAKANAPCIVFLDEIDAVGRKRGSGLGGGHDEREQTLNAILVEMDGMDTNANVIIMASTNRPDVLDPALLRPGRFDRHVYVDLPDIKGREDILRVHARKIKLSPHVDLHMIARATPMFSGAELENLLNEAALIAVRKDKDAIDKEDIEEARDKVLFGREKKSRVKDMEELVGTAYHEAGHAVTSWMEPHALKPHKVTIIPRGRSLGSTHFLPEKDIHNKNKEQLEADLVVAYGGRVAERIHTKTISTGAKGDIDQASEIARHMVCQWGMSEKVGPIKYSASEETIFLGREIARTQEFSEATQKIIDDEVKKLIDDAFKKAEVLVEKHKDAVKQVAEALMKQETLSREDLERILGTPTPV